MQGKKCLGCKTLPCLFKNPFHYYYLFQVLKDHEDFNNGKNKPDLELIDTKPVFKLIKQNPKRIVLIIDRALVYDSPNTLLSIKRVIELVNTRLYKL